jgi:hypothetical protein
MCRQNIEFSLNFQLPVWVDLTNGAYSLRKSAIQAATRSHSDSKVKMDRWCQVVNHNPETDNTTSPGMTLSTQRSTEANETTDESEMNIRK